MKTTSPSASRPKADTSWLSRTVQAIPVGSAGTFLGMLEGVRCFNCEPGIVHLNLSDSLTREAGFLSLRLEIWNRIERPLRDRRMYDHANQCFFFGYQAVDTAWVGGERAEIRIRELPCYPYLQRRLNSPAPASTQLPVPMPVRAPVPRDSGTDSGSRAPAPGAPGAPAAPAPAATSPVPPIKSDSTRAPAPPVFQTP